MNMWKRLCALVATALLVACATTSPMPASTVSMLAFDMNGRLAVHYQDKAFSGAVRWTSNAGIDELWINTPMGQAVAYVRADNTGATLTTAEQKQYSASSIEKLTQRALGWRLPVAPLHYWVRGEAAPDLPQQEVQRDAQGRLTSITQDVWHVAFIYANAGMTPARIELTADDAVLKLVIDRLEAQ